MAWTWQGAQQVITMLTLTCLTTPKPDVRNMGQDRKGEREVTQISH